MTAGNDTRTEPDALSPPVGSPEAGAAPSRLASWQVPAALVVVVLAIGTVVVLSLVTKAKPVVSGPLPVATVGQPGAESAACRALMPGLPAALGKLTARTLEGGGPGITAWGDPAVLLRCGLETPAELTCSSELSVINTVSWLVLSEVPGQATYLAADRSVRIAVTVPDGSGTGPIQQLSNAIADRLPLRRPCRNGVLLPTDAK